MDPSLIKQTLADQSDPKQFLLEKIYSKAFGEQPLQSEAYQTLGKINPVMVGGTYKGDAADFLGNTVQGPYAKLQELVKRLAASIGAEPFPGEHITAFIERVVGMASSQALHS